MTCRLVGTLALCVSGAVAGAADLQVRRTVDLEGSPEATWSAIGDYCAIQEWHPAVARCAVVSGKSNLAGAIRVLTLKDGATLREELVQYDAKGRTYTYRFLETPLPVVSYLATIAVLPRSAGGSVVEWRSTFQAAPGTDDAAARTAIEGIYDAGLASLHAKEATKGTSSRAPSDSSGRSPRER